MSIDIQGIIMRADFSKPTPILNTKQSNLIQVFAVIASADKPIRSVDIGKILGLSKSAVENYLCIANKTDYIKGVKGPRGGTQLSVPAKQISLLDIVGKITTIDNQDLGIQIVYEKLVELLDTINLQDVLDWGE